MLAHWLHSYKQVYYLILRLSSSQPRLCCCVLCPHVLTPSLLTTKAGGAGKMADSMACLLWKHESLTSIPIPGTHVKSLGVVMCLCNPSTVDGRQANSWGSLSHQRETLFQEATYMGSEGQYP